ncbi:acyltransferase family protein [Roseibacillus persicicus]|uniref:acyltransferase family protein n=1 Tax=Roseibacillus persicicus TaxID=454148 RepID=UPI00398ADA20
MKKEELNQSLSYRPELDSLRALAVMAVVLFHLDAKLCMSGHLGVDIFFVLSGFLITSIIAPKIAAGDFSLVNFWERRIKRILPLAFLVVTCTLLASQFFLFRNELKEFSTDGAASLLSVANLRMLFSNGSYWGGQAERTPFLHYWSLSVEEQFYFFFPILLLLVAKFRLRIFPVIAILCFASFIAYMFESHRSPDSAFYLPQFRAWELLIGALAAVWKSPPNLLRRLPSAFSLICLIMIGVLLFMAPLGKSFLQNLFVCILTIALILLYPGAKGVMKKIAEFAPLVYLGKISFSVYLWHWPIIVIFKEHSNEWGAGEVSAILGLTFTLSALSYALIENRIRLSQVNPGWVLVSGLIPLTYCFFLRSPLVSKTYRVTQHEVPEFYFLKFEISPKNVKLSPLGAVVPPKPKMNFGLHRETHGLESYRADSESRVLLLGDSHGGMWANQVLSVCKEQNWSLNSFVCQGYPPFFEIPINPEKLPVRKNFSKAEAREYAEARLQTIDTGKYDAILLAARWEVYVRDEEVITKFISYLSKSAPVIVFCQPPRLELENIRVGQYVYHRGWQNKEEILLAKRDLGKVKSLEARLGLLPNVFLFDSGIVEQQSQVVVADKNRVFYFDDDHLSEQGAEFRRVDLAEQMRSILVP